jgi:cysteinyl-tRNA synthetase
MDGKRELRIYNSLSKKKEALDTKGSTIKWYTCGPTVYDSAHLGHARTYLVLDSIRKLLERYFGYNVFYIMNITDIDDKIIIRAREVREESVEDGDELVSRIKSMSVGEEQERIHSMCKEISRKYENEFFRDLSALDVDQPTIVTRVTEYVEEIVKFIEKIESEGYAYHSEDGSVYFDIYKFREKHVYPKMLQRSEQTQDLLEEGEGKLQREGRKRHKEDFSLWKKSKAGEPAWPSKWGEGRPGWHIECSVMASNITGEHMDIHSGGIDLLFPHHENEIVQCEGAGMERWVSHFMHTGHLHIHGAKMSKSLKNFILIKDLLKEGTAREVRMMFLLQHYRGPMSYRKESMEQARAVEGKIFRFISKHLSHEETNATGPFKEGDRRSLEEFYRKVDEVDSALKDDFDIPKAIEIIISLISSTKEDGDRGYSPVVLRAIATYVRRIMVSLGMEVKRERAGGKEEELLGMIGDFRNEVRRIAISNGTGREYFSACDKVRERLSETGIIIEDDKKNSSMRKTV